MLEILVFSAYQSLTTISGRFSSISSFQYPSFFRVISWDLKHGLQQKQKHSKQLHRTHLSTSALSLPAWLSLNAHPDPECPRGWQGWGVPLSKPRADTNCSASLQITGIQQTGSRRVLMHSWQILIMEKQFIFHCWQLLMQAVCMTNTSCFQRLRALTLSGERIWFARPQLLLTTFGRRTEKFSTRCDSLIPSATHCSL